MEFASLAMEQPAPPVIQEEPQPGKHLRNQLAAAVRSINWSYAIFWSVSSSYPPILTWKDGFYNDVIKTRKIANSLELTANQLIFQRSDQLRELYESLLSGRCDNCAARPIVSLSPEDLGDMEWYYIICMTYDFQLGQGLPGKSFASNEHVWLCNAHLADSKTFHRALLAKKASIQTIVCIPLRGGVLELGTTASVPEDPDLINRATISFTELKLTRCSENSSENKNEDTNYVSTLDDLDQEAVISEEHGTSEVDCLFSDKLEQIINVFDDLYDGPWEELDMQSFQDSRCVMDTSSLVATPLVNNKVDAALSEPGYSSRTTSFISWTRFQSGERTVPIIGVEPQKLLKKVVGSRTWTNNNDGESTARSTQERCIKNHVISERRRREKLNEMFLVLKSLVPTIRKTDKASILAETIVYLKELHRKVKEFESWREPISSPNEKTPRWHDKRVPARAQKKASKISSDMEMEHHWVCSEDGESKVNVTVIGTEVHLEVKCPWKEWLMTHVFDTMKSLHLDVLSVEASTPNYLMALKIRAQFSSPNDFLPGAIMEALRTAIANHSRDN